MTMSGVKPEQHEEIPVEEETGHLNHKEHGTSVDYLNEQDQDSKTNDKPASNTSNNKRKKGPNVFICKWVECKKRNYPTLTALVNHLSSTHLAHIAHLSPTTPIRYTCHWEGCPRFAMEQPSRFALISHCRTHTGEKPYFCPIPECEKHFTRSDALAKHVKGVHDLHLARDALTLIKDRIKKDEIAPILPNNADLDEYEYLSIIDQDYELRNPWWFTKAFIDVLRDSTCTMDSIYNQPFNTQQYKLANSRYKAYIDNNDEEIIPPIENSETDESSPKSIYNEQLQKAAKAIVTTNAVTDPIDESVIENTNELEALKSIHDTLKKQLATAAKINKTVAKQLSSTVNDKRRLWLINQTLLDGNVALGLPSEGDPNSEPDLKRPFLDKYDEEMLLESVSSTDKKT